jgi:CheY-like chemotaxis protein
MDTDKVVLVMEDEKPLSDAIKSKLERSGFMVTVARTVDQALGYLEDLKKVDVIWLDHYLLGKEDGLDFVTKIKSNGGKWSAIPIFVVSNTASPEKVQSYIRLGINKYYVKAEHRLDEIISEIQSYLKDPKE